MGQNFTETRRSTETVPGGTRHTEYTVKSEAYSSLPRTEFVKTETREVEAPYATSTPNKFVKSEFSQQYSQRSERSSYGKNASTELVKVATPESSERIRSPYGGPDYLQETTTEVKEIPNGTQKITTTKVYSSSPVTISATDTKYEPIRLEGIDELSKSFDDDSRFGTLDSRPGSDGGRSFMRPSDFQTSTTVTEIRRPAELAKELDSMENRFSKRTIKSETVERRSVMTSSHKSETSSTVTKKFGNV